MGMRDVVRERVSAALTEWIVVEVWMGALVAVVML